MIQSHLADHKGIDVPGPGPYEPSLQPWAHAQPLRYSQFTAGLSIPWFNELEEKKIDFSSSPTCNKV